MLLNELLLQNHVLRYHLRGVEQTVDTVMCEVHSQKLKLLPVTVHQSSGSVLTCNVSLKAECNNH